MIKDLEIIREYADILRLTQLKKEPEKLLHQAQIDKPTYIEFIRLVLEREIVQRQKTDYDRRIMLARLPKDCSLDKYDYNHANGLGKQQLNELRQLLWLEQNYNIVLMGPSGTGKTFMATGLINDAVNAGYRAYFKTMEEIITILRLKEMTSSAMNGYNRLLKAHLIAIDDIMLFPMKKTEAVAFFNLVNHLHEKTSVIITTNKSPRQWAETLDDEVLATALLDRLLYRCEVIKLSGNSYRMENRKNIFEQSPNEQHK